MARMRDFAHEAEEAVFGHHRHHQTPATTPVNLAPAGAATQGEHMSSFIEDLDNFVTEAKAIGEDGIAKYKAIKANPETADLVEDLAGLATTVGIPQGFITGVGQALKVLRAAYQPDPAPAGVAQTATAQTAVQPAVQ